MSNLAANLPPIEDDKLWSLLARGEELGLRLELTDTGIVWETMPGLRHQELAVAIYSAIQRNPLASACECYRALDIYIKFPGGLVKRPDISIFCRRPSEDEGFVQSLPEAVIEITSPDSEDKDLISGPVLYLANGVKDVVVVHRSQNVVHHWTEGGRQTFPSPTVIHLSCGCGVSI